MAYRQRNTRPGAENTFLKNNGLSEKIIKIFFGVVFKTPHGFGHAGKLLL